jgi:xylulokinase
MPLRFVHGAGSNQPALSDSEPLFLAIDASTTAVRAVVFDSSGETLAVGRHSLVVVEPEALHYEQDAESWWSATVRAVGEASGKLSPEERDRIAAAVIGHQRETVVLTDRKGKALAPALLWLDARSEVEVREATQRIGAVRIHGLSGKQPNTSPSIYKLMHLQKRYPELRDIACAHDIHSFLSLRLTGRAVSSFASADPWGLVDMRAKKWSLTLLGLVGLEPHQLPEIVEPGYLIGPLQGERASELGLPPGVLLYAGSGDAQLAGLGAGVTKTQQCFVELGTQVTACVLSPSYEIGHAYRTLFSAIPGVFCLESTLRGGMQTVWWWIEGQLGKSERRPSLAELDEKCRSIAPGSDGLVALPYWAGVMSPFWDDRARGVLLGLHPGHRPEHIHRAILEGIAYELRLGIEAMEASVGKLEREIRVIGGGSRSDVWCQILADVLRRPIVRASTADASALGSAMLGAVSHGIYGNLEEAVNAMVHFDSRFEPGPAEDTYEQVYRGVYRGLYQDLRQRLHILSDVRRSAALPAPEDGEDS